MGRRGRVEVEVPRSEGGFEEGREVVVVEEEGGERAWRRISCNSS